MRLRPGSFVSVQFPHTPTDRPETYALTWIIQLVQPLPIDFALTWIIQLVQSLPIDFCWQIVCLDGTGAPESESSTSVEILMCTSLLKW